MKIGKFETHPAADLFPLLEGSEFDALVADVKQRGVDIPIIVQTKSRGTRPLLLDGRNRERARLAANAELAKDGKAPIVLNAEEFDGRHPVRFIIAANLHRRHLTVGQRAIIGAKLAVLLPGRPQGDADAETPTQAEAALMLGISERAVRQGRAVLNACSDVVAAVERGAIALDLGEKIAHQPAEKQKDLVRLAAKQGSIRHLLRDESVPRAPRGPSEIERALDALRNLLALVATHGLDREPVAVAARSLVVELTGETNVPAA